MDLRRIQKNAMRLAAILGLLFVVIIPSDRVQHFLRVSQLMQPSTVALTVGERLAFDQILTTITKFISTITPKSAFVTRHELLGDIFAYRQLTLRVSQRSRAMRQS